MSGAFFFGYGSLVNQGTHHFAPLHHASAHGWRRAWRYTGTRKVAYLTAVRDPGCTIHGMIAHVPADDWQALDRREAAYDRLGADVDITHDAPGVAELAMYAIAPERMHLPTAAHPLLLSYLDVVVQGYLAEYGAGGAAHFFATTIGWEAPILDDRAAPLYPRAQRLGDAERAVVDHGLAAMGCRKIAA
ncbi:hypothetical protein AL036_06845 [Salipiger aestuarii]|uniref:Gamma-glutamyl AIG2-like cyclotransferase n=1 Tax=Salipiger aestuarii TaxID=568098 RepID=A0A327YB45_9RHOB|nr:gamma-glutamylcyclotransferase family protein [Salipiger aestuarii]KAA8608588.1 hypothetical protein AL036_06845 [Salipiger aestuarii]KAB2542339.1 hypothetical protein AL035_07375 [Salipiger aestuarii]RAK18348.1 gamma-glutamyl AIG2-like cyclotransferase [Salipiger aestuarii]